MIRKTAADFFAGIGLVSYGLSLSCWLTYYAVDHSFDKRRVYAANFDPKHYQCADIATISGSDMPRVTLAHASFPCTDTSLAGARRGIDSGESAAFWDFARILSEIQMEDSSQLPPIIMLENESGLLSSGGGKDIVEILTQLNNLGYFVDVLQIDAARFVPQSRVRLFIIGNRAVAPPVRELDLRELLTESSDARPKRVRDLILDNPQN